MHTETGVDIQKAAIFYRKAMVAIPTETGIRTLAANALNADAVLKIGEVKQRPQFNPLIVHGVHGEQALQFVGAGTLKQNCWRKNIPAQLLCCSIRKKQYSGSGYCR